MSAYTVYDFSESLAGQNIDRNDVRRVIAAWGGSPEGYASWVGGFLMEMKDGYFSYLTGWCDTTGWGCQDGTELYDYDSEPSLKSLEKIEPSDWAYVEKTDSEKWDIDPADLNRFILGEIEAWD